MSLRWKFQAAFSIGLVLLVLQALLTGYFIQQLQEAVHGISFHIKARDLRTTITDHLDKAVKSIQDMQETEDPVSQLEVVEVYQREVAVNVDVLLANLTQMKIYGESNQKIQAAFSGLEEQFQGLQKNFGNQEALLEQAYFFEDSAIDLKTLLGKIDVDLRKGLETAIQKEQVIHDRPIEASWIICGFAAFVLIGFAWQFARSLTQPIQRLANRLTLMADGDLRGNPIKLPGRDELAQLGQAMDGVSLNLRNVLFHVNGTTLQMENAASHVMEISEKMNQGIQEQQSQTQMVATAMEEMSATSQEVANQAIQAASSTKIAAEEASKGSQVVRESIGSIHSLANEVIRAGDSIESLALVSKKINMVIEVINGIAEQTNLLALNAAIEAARAGEQGRGFAIVADEVRNLATRTEMSTREIKDMIKELEVGTGEAVNVMGTGQTQARVSVEQASQAETSLTSITQAVENIREVNNIISQTVEDQRMAVEATTKNFNSITQISSQTSEDAKKTYEANVELSQLAGLLKEVVSEFKV